MDLCKFALSFFTWWKVKLIQLGGFRGLLDPAFLDSWLIFRKNIKNTLLEYYYSAPEITRWNPGQYKITGFQIMLLLAKPRYDPEE